MDFLNYIFVESGDKRVYDWPFMATPYKLFIIDIIYILIVVKLLPIFMKNRQPYNLKAFMCLYNIFQIVACLYFIYGYINVGFDVAAAFTCKGNTLNIPKEMEINATKLTYQFFYLKNIEFIETIIFALRKNTRQITKLHLYHHTSTVLLAWIVVKYVGSAGLPIYTIFINTIVHLFMYSYYFLTSYNKNINPKFMGILKKSITIIQLTQFIVFIVHVFLIYIQRCEIPFGVFLAYIPNITVLLFAFYDFYKTAYSKNNIILINKLK